MRTALKFMRHPGFVLAAILLAGPPVHAGDPPPKSAVPVKNPQRTVQPLESESSMIMGSMLHDGPFGFNQTPITRGGGGETDDVGDDSPELMFGLSWTQCMWHRLSADAPTEAVLEADLHTSVPVVWQLSNGENAGGLLNALPFVENLNGSPGQGLDIPLDWEYRLDNSLWIPLLPGENFAFYIPVPPGDHVLEVRITGFLPQVLDEGYYRLTLNHQMTPQL